MAVSNRPTSGRGRIQSVVGLAVCLAVPFGAAAAGSWATSRALDDWYPSLAKPGWTPPGSTIGAVWSVLYTLMGISAWLVWRRADASSTNVYRWFFVQLGLNTTWSFAFFGLRSPLAGLVAIVPLFAAVVGWAIAAGRVSPLAGCLQIPYAAWVAFAGFLNATIWWLNPS
jgi:tryptophan-rich sensory protein